MLHMVHTIHKLTFEHSEGRGWGPMTGNIPSTDTVDTELEVKSHRTRTSKLPWALLGDWILFPPSWEWRE